LRKKLPKPVAKPRHVFSLLVFCPNKDDKQRRKNNDANRDKQVTRARLLEFRGCNGHATSGILFQNYNIAKSRFVSAISGDKSLTQLFKHIKSVNAAHDASGARSLTQVLLQSRCRMAVHAARRLPGVAG
jgi:hypothetical protein